MDETLLNLLTNKNLALPGNRPLLLVILGPYAAAQAMLTLAAHLARRGPLQVLDGGNRFNAYIVARQLRRLAGLDTARTQPGPAPARPGPVLAQPGPVPDLRQCLDRIRVARAFTCYQMAALLAQQPVTPQPVVVLDLLATFYDENVAWKERLWLLEACQEHLRALRQQAPLVISANPPRLAQADELLDRLVNLADQVWQFTAASPEEQPRLL